MPALGVPAAEAAIWGVFLKQEESVREESDGAGDAENKLGELLEYW